MSIKIWTGISGAGKTKQMFDEIDEETAHSPLGPGIYIITPTQNTLRYENIITSRGGTDGRSGSLRAGVFSFARFIWHVFNETGHQTRDALSESGHIMMLHKMMTEMKTELKFYKDSAQYIRFSNKVLDMLKEFNAYRVAPEDLNRIESDSGRMQDKFSDLHSIYGQWLKRTEALQIEALDLTDQFISLLYSDAVIHGLEDAVIYIDGFHNFTESEYAMIQALATRVKTINILLTHQGENKQLFRKTDTVIERLRFYMGDASLDFLHFGRAFKRSEKRGLIQLEQHFAKYEKMFDYDGVTITEAPNVLEEVTEVAREIERIVFDGEGYYKDIGILYRDESYEPVLDSVFRRFNISWHVDRKVPMYAHPFIQFIMALLECYVKNYEFSAFMNVLKTGYLSKSADSIYIDQLENFALERGLSGTALFDDDKFKYISVPDNDGGLRVEDKSAYYQEMIDFKNEVLGKLKRLYDDFGRELSVRDYIGRIYDFIIDEGIAEKIEDEMNDLDARKEIQKRDETEQAFNMFIRLLDDAYMVFDDAAVSFEVFYETFLDGLKNAEFSLLPSTIDQVMAGSLDLSKVENKKYIFMIGVNRDVLPKDSSNGELVSDEEKALFDEAGIELSPTSKTLGQDERFVFYLGITRATDRLYLSFSSTKSNGETTKMSPFLAEILPEDETRVLNYEYRRTSEYSRFNPDLLISSAKSMEPLMHLKMREMLASPAEDAETFLALPEYRPWVEAYHLLMKYSWYDIYPRLKRNLTYDNRAADITQEAAELLYGDEMTASVSRFETFHRCQFQHFAAYGLKLKIRKPYQVAPLELGNLYHEVLYDTVKSLRFTLAHDEGVIRRQVSKSIDTFAAAIQFGIFDYTGYYQSLKKRAEDAIVRLILFMKEIEMLGEYKIADAELSFGFTHSPINEVTLESDAGRKIHLRGKIDRIDMYETGEGAYVNLIDYKSSTRSISKEGILNGLELQMMTYMYVLVQKGPGYFKKGKIMPNSMLFFPVRDPLVSFKTETSPEALEKEQKKKMKPDGAFINEAPDYDTVLNEASIGISGMLSGLETFQEYGTYYPITVSRNDRINASTKGRYFSPMLFEHYAEYIMSLYRETTDRIYAGEVLASPMTMDRNNKQLACEMCDFKSVCHIDPLMNRQDIRKNKVDDEVIREFESEVETDDRVDR